MSSTTLVNLPNPTDLFAVIGTWSSPLFSQLLPIALVVLGFFIGGSVVYFLIEGIMRAISAITHRGDKF
jgi:hypothetical protein